VIVKVNIRVITLVGLIALIRTKDQKLSDTEMNRLGN